MIAASFEMLIECVPELRGRSELIVRTLLPGPFTLVLPNPARRYGWLARERPETIGVRVAMFPTEAQRVLDTVGAVAGRAPTSRARPRRRASTTSLSRSVRLRRRDRCRPPFRPSLDRDRLQRPGAARCSGSAPATPRRRSRSSARRSLDRRAPLAPTTAGRLRWTEATKERTMAIVQETFEHLKTAGLAEIDREIAGTLERSSRGSAARSS